MYLKAFVYAGYSGFTKRNFVIKNGIKNEPAITVIKPFGTVIMGSNPIRRTKWQPGKTTVRVNFDCVLLFILQRINYPNEKTKKRREKVPVLF